MLPAAAYTPQVLCECLVYACCIRQRLPAGDVADLADLLHRLGLKARAGGSADLAAHQQAYCVLLAALLALLPLENAEGAGEDMRRVGEGAPGHARLVLRGLLRGLLRGVLRVVLRGLLWTRKAG